MRIVFPILLIVASGGYAQESVLPLEGGPISARIEAIDAKQVRLDGGRTVEIQKLQRIDRSARLQDKQPAIVVHLIDGSAIRAQDVSVADDTCRITWAAGEPITLPLSAIRGIRFALGDNAHPDPAPLPQFEQALATDKAKEDAMYVVADGQTQVVQGALQRIDPREITFVWSGTARKLPRTKPYGVTFAALKPSPELSGLCLVRAIDHSTIWGRPRELRDGKLILTANERDISIAWEKVTQVLVRSDRVTYLSDLEPAEVVEEALVTFPGPWRRDRSVLGHPLTLGSTTYERGLGVHSRCLLTFATDAKYAFFSAVIGIDAETKGRGDCEFKVIADGKELFAKAIKAADKPLPIRVPITGIKRLTLAVEPGEDLDIADHGDWCEARLEKAE